MSKAPFGCPQTDLQAPVAATAWHDESGPSHEVMPSVLELPREDAVAPDTTALRRRSAIGLVLRLVTLAVAAATNLLIARSLGVSGFGQLSIAVALAGVVVQLSDFGITQAVTRLGSERPQDLGRIANAAATVGVALTTGVAAVACAISFLAYGHRTAVVIAVLLAVSPFASSAILTGVANARGRPDLGPLISLSQAALAACIAVGIALTQPSPLAYAGGAATATVLQALLYVRFSTAHHPLRPCLEPKLLRALLRYSWPIGVLGLFVTAYYRVDSIIVYQASGSAALGLYAAGYRFIDVAQVLPAALVAPLIPMLVTARARSHHEASATLTTFVRWGLIGGFGIAAVIVGSAPALLAVTFGSAYAKAALATSVLGLSFIPICVGYVFTAACVASGRTAQQLKLVSVLAVASIVAQALLIPKFGIVAAAVVTVATEAGANTIAAMRALDATPIHWREIPVAAIFIAFITAAGAGYTTSNSPWSIVVSGGTFALAAGLLRITRRHDVRHPFGRLP